MIDSLIVNGLVAAACGLLIGIERGWQQRAEPAGSRISGVRTFTLIGLIELVFIGGTVWLVPRAAAAPT